MGSQRVRHNWATNTFACHFHGLITIAISGPQIFLPHLLCAHGKEEGFCPPFFVVVAVAVQLLSHVQLFATPWTAARQASLSFPISQSLLKFISIVLAMPSNHLILCHPLLLLPSIFPSIRVFSNESALPIKWPKYWRCSFRISPYNEFSKWISFRIDCFDLLSVQATLKSLLHHSHSLKALILWHSTFFLRSSSHIRTCLLEKNVPLIVPDLCWQSDVSAF